MNQPKNQILGFVVLSFFFKIELQFGFCNFRSHLIVILQVGFVYMTMNYEFELFPYGIQRVKYRFVISLKAQ